VVTSSPSSDNSRRVCPRIPFASRQPRAPVTRNKPGCRIHSAFLPRVVDTRCGGAGSTASRSQVVLLSPLRQVLGRIEYVGFRHWFTFGVAQDLGFAGVDPVALTFLVQLNGLLGCGEVISELGRVAQNVLEPETDWPTPLGC